MFTGLVETLGTFRGRRGREISVSAPAYAGALALGESVATQGICLTVTAMTREGFTADYSEATEAATTIPDWRPGQALHLERALRVGDRLGGHIVTGHVDGTGEIVAVGRQEGGTALTVRVPKALMRYAVAKGSIAIDGVSLTIVETAPEAVTVMIIPHTGAATTLQDARPGRRVNLEMDCLGKYVERLLGARAENARGPALLETIARWSQES